MTSTAAPTPAQLPALLPPDPAATSWSRRLAAPVTFAIFGLVDILVFGRNSHGSVTFSFTPQFAKVTVPMLFLQGTRDAFASLDLLRPVCAKLGPLATLHLIDSADHSFHVPKSSGKTDADVLRELAQTTATWANKLEN